MRRMALPSARRAAAAAAPRLPLLGAPSRTPPAVLIAGGGTLNFRRDDRGHPVPCTVRLARQPGGPAMTNHSPS